ncbi:UNVERIFIED_CONTAM: hypothetical protein K2H54_008622 [Gekko kuhli]
MKHKVRSEQIACCFSALPPGSSHSNSQQLSPRRMGRILWSPELSVYRSLKELCSEQLGIGMCASASLPILVLVAKDRSLNDGVPREVTEFLCSPKIPAGVWRHNNRSEKSA